MSSSPALASPLPSSPQAALIGIGLTVAACALLALLDSGTKYASQALPMAMVVWLRFTSQALLTAAVVLPLQGRQALRTRCLRLQLWRALTSALTTVFAFFCISTMPLANFTATWSAAPLLIVVVSALLFGERVAPARWVLLLVGLCAVLAIVRPSGTGSTLGWQGVLMPVGVLISGTTYQLISARLARIDPPGTTQLYSTALPALASLPLLPWIWHSVPTWQLWACALVMGACSSLGHLLMLKAYTRASAITVSPFLYTQIGFAMLLGWLFFDQMPDTIAFIGIAVVMACGLIGMWLSVRGKG